MKISTFTVYSPPIWQLQGLIVIGKDDTLHGDIKVTVNGADVTTTDEALELEY